MKILPRAQPGKRMPKGKVPRLSARPKQRGDAKTRQGETGRWEGRKLRDCARTYEPSSWIWRLSRAPLIRWKRPPLKRNPRNFARWRHLSSGARQKRISQKNDQGPAVTLPFSADGTFVAQIEHRAIHGARCARRCEPP